MNILFMSLGEFHDLSASSVHIDVVRELAKSNNVYLACKAEAHKNDKKGISEEYGIHVLRVQTGVIKTKNFIAKGISTVLLEPTFKREIKRNFNSVKFDLVIYTTPPITFVEPIKYVKKRDSAITYLMLKDIFPQNAVDLGVMSNKGISSLAYLYFRRKEKTLYEISDFIGCMSPKNVKYIAQNNKEIDQNKLEIFPNSTYIEDIKCSTEQRNSIRKKYGLPVDKKIFIYGGNLGKPQGIPFMLKCMDAVKGKDACFLIVGNGTEFEKIKTFKESSQQENLFVFNSLPKLDYNMLVAACDVGMIFLDHRFEIPNFPSRILSYMQCHLPILAVTDPNTDVGEIIEHQGFGWWCESNDVEAFAHLVDKSVSADMKAMGDKGFLYLAGHYDVEKNCAELLARIEKRMHER